MAGGRGSVYMCVFTLCVKITVFAILSFLFLPSFNSFIILLGLMP